jgi:hypothetical protein
MVLGVNISVSDAAEKAMLHKPALDFMSDPGKSRIELLSTVIFIHGTPHHYTIPIDLTPSDTCLLFKQRLGPHQKGLPLKCRRIPKEESRD